MNMIEKVARALYEDEKLMDAGTLDADESWENFTHIAITAINAMREPTEGMMTVGGEYVPVVPKPVRDKKADDIAFDVYVSMIDAAHRLGK